MPCTQFQQESGPNALPESYLLVQFEQPVSEADLVKLLLGMPE